MFTERLKNANVLVTGGSSETGAFICRAFGEAGANVALTYYSREERAREACDLIRSLGGYAQYYYLNLLSERSIETLIERFCADYNRLDVLVLCAGSVGLRNFEKLLREELDVAYDGNVKGNFMLAKEFGYWMKRSPASAGRIIQLSARSAENTSHSAYGMAKAAQDAMGRFLAYNLGPEVTVNTLAPMRIDQDPEHAIAEQGDSLMGRIVHAREIARMCLLLCDEAFDSVTGERIRMDCGRHVVPAYPREM